MIRAGRVVCVLLHDCRIANDVPVAAFDPNAFGSFQAAACSGTVTLQIEGPYMKP